MIYRFIILLLLIFIVILTAKDESLISITDSDTLNIEMDSLSLFETENDTISLFQVDDNIKIQNGFNGFDLGVESDKFKKGSGNHGIQLLTFQNPFNPETIVQFELLKKSSIKIDVFDINGNLTKSLVNGILNEGEHLIKFDSDNLKSGTYIIKFDINKETIDLKKIVLIN
ncbi:MAG: hypothetical protein CR982_06370 [Candidatus Cloacimonadota bacterium]|nr:MAG: hypothetical protein CR982_06370 [Candidatus Cloacimonadota bacterium]PIE77908.1 MAG: hypothetical protein CSA15_10475 [Candidatus Delongbacteria bacterium]